MIPGKGDSHLFPPREARDDLDGIYSDVAQDSPPAADRLIDAIESRFRLLASNPLMGEARPELAPGLRSFSVGNYVIFFRPRDNGIDVARVLHGAQDINRIF